MHERGVTHRDIKLENILLDASANALLCDLGFSEINASGRLFECKGTPGYMAPEMFTGEGYLGPQVDVFALGVVLFALLMGRPPFEYAHLQDQFYGLLVEKPHEFWSAWEAYASANEIVVSDDFKTLFTSMVNFNPEKRPSVEEILASDWVDVKEEDLLTEMEACGEVQVYDTAGCSELSHDQDKASDTSSVVDHEEANFKDTQFQDMVGQIDDIDMVGDCDWSGKQI